jgi:hypothetical protein
MSIRASMGNTRPGYRQIDVTPPERLKAIEELESDGIECDDLREKAFVLDRGHPYVKRGVANVPTSD